MKKRYLLILIVAILLIILAAVLIIVLLPSKGGKGDDLQAWQAKYAKIVEAKEISQSISVKSGKLEQFISEKTFTATSSGYSVVGREKKLNEINSDTGEAYTETPVSYQVESAAKFLPTLTLKADYFESDYTLTESLLKVNVIAGKETAVLGIQEQLPAPTTNMTLTLSANGDRLTSIVISYSSNQSTVSITLTFTY